MVPVNDPQKFSPSKVSCYTVISGGPEHFCCCPVDTVSLLPSTFCQGRAVLIPILDCPLVLLYLHASELRMSASGETKRPNPTRARKLSHLQDPMWGLHHGIYWTVGSFTCVQDKRAQEGSPEWGSEQLYLGRTCLVATTPCRLGSSRSVRDHQRLVSEVHDRVVAYPQWGQLHE